MAAVLESTLGGIGSLVSMPIRSYLTRLIRDQLLHYVREDCIDMQRISLGGTLVLHNPLVCMCTTWRFQYKRDRIIRARECVAHLVSHLNAVPRGIKR